MSLQNATPAPKKAEIESHVRDELAKTFALIHDQHFVDITDVASKVNINSRYARELVGILVNHGWAEEVTSPDGDTVWGLHEDLVKMEDEAAVTAKFTTWLDARMPAPRTATPTKGTSAPKSPRAPRNPAAATKPCLCGCEALSSREYAPGHDARHAGQVAREIAQTVIANGGWVGTEDEVRDALNELPSQKLRDKAYAHAGRLVEKASKLKTDEPATPAPTPVYGTVKIGRWTYHAKQVDNVVTRSEVKPGSEASNAADNLKDLEYKIPVTNNSTFKPYTTQPA